MIKLVQPTYVLTLPSNGKKVKYRPFVVKEEKALLLAMQSDDSRAIIENIKNIVHECTFNEANPDKIPYYDLEYIFLMIRGKSVSEMVDLVGSCECGAKTDFQVNVESAKVEGMNQNSKFKIEGTDYFVEMVHPSINYFINDEKEDSEKEDSYYTAAAQAIKQIYTDEEVFDEMSVKEKVDFLDNLTSKQQRPIAEFIKLMPKLVVNGQYDCIKCNKHHEVDVSGVERFFV
jgi:hypothetical protein